MRKTRLDARAALGMLGMPEHLFGMLGMPGILSMEFCVNTFFDEEMNMLLA